MRLACRLGEIVWVTKPDKKQIVKGEDKGLRSRKSTNWAIFQYSAFKLSGHVDK